MSLGRKFYQTIHWCRANQDLAGKDLLGGLKEVGLEVLLEEYKSCEFC